ncbi:hypothetical protein ACPCSC_10310 [Streptomyces lavendulocolor]|uniref:hypothetical protein n=1 Tax=Streptomyces lavendulocolor TaxID=67316 RepID=UPI003C2C13B5
MADDYGGCHRVMFRGPPVRCVRCIRYARCIRSVGGRSGAEGGELSRTDAFRCLS